MTVAPQWIKDLYLQVADELCDGKEWCWHGTDEPLQRFAALVAAAEREACCSIVHGQCESDNVAQRTVDAIRARGVKP